VKNKPNRRILLIDDNPAIHGDFSKILRPQALTSSQFDAAKAALFGRASPQTTDVFELDSAYQGEEGWMKVCESVRNSRPYALAFVDMRMPPGWDGLETIGKLWEADPQLQVVICTAYSDYSLDVIQTQLDGRDRLLILKKPFDMIEVRQLAKTLSAKWDLTQQAVTAMSDLEEMVKERTDALAQANKELRLKHHAIESATNAIILINNHETANPVEYVNPAFEKLTGYRAGEVVGKNVSFLYGEDLAQPGLQTLQQAISSSADGHTVLRNFRKDGTPFWSEWHLAPVVETGELPSHFVGVLNDITNARELEELLKHRANYDALTGLPNRVLLMDRMLQAIAIASRQQERVVTGFIDLDHFKLINDTLGHDAGDQLLKEIAARLLDCIRESDTVARLGGDEFVILIHGEEAESIALSVMQRIIQSVSQPVVLRSETHVVSCSIGVAIYPHDGTDTETLLKKADIALYQAKEIGRNRFQFFKPEMNDRLERRLKLERELHAALERHEFQLYYQPQVDLHSGMIVGCEALIRWLHPERGLVMPGEFIPVAEESDLILRIGEWVLREACRQRGVWKKAGMRALPVAINLSPVQFERQDVVTLVKQNILESGLEWGALELEMTESLSMKSPERTIALLEKLKELGVSVAIDDFGTGYSNLSYLKKYPVSKIKLDRAFVRDITKSPEDIAISSAIIEMGHCLNLKVVAEGIEREGQMAMLRAHGCDQLQGFLFRPAIPANEFAELVHTDCKLPLGQEVPTKRARTILLVDDDPSVLAALTRLLASKPYTILQAKSADEGLALLEQHEIDVVLSDYRMPGMHGLDFLSGIEAQYPHVVRMILSAETDRETLLNAINQGTVFKYICKPWDRDELLLALEQAFERATRRHIEPTILVVDDDPASLNIAKQALASQSYRTLTAGSVGDAFELLSVNQVQVVLTDNRMPDMSGLEFLRRVQKMYPQSVRMILSGFSESDLLLDTINNGLAFKYLCKPCSSQELISAVNAAFAKSKSLDPYIDIKLRGRYEIKTAV